MKKSLLKKVITLSVAAAMVFAVVACSDKTEETEAAEETAQETVAEEADETEVDETEAVADETEAAADETEAAAQAVDCADSALVGTWSYGSYVYTFNADGTGDYSGSALTWEDLGDKISILYDGFTSPMELEYSIEGDTLTIVDSFGEGVEYTR